MAYASDAARTRRVSARALGFLPGATAQPDDGPEHQGRDWKKLVLVIGLGTLSWVATYVGMLELIEANMGDLPLIHKAIIGFSVAMLMTMIIWLLDQIFSPVGIIQKLSYVAGYVFLSIISVGFGFGFYWKVLESRSESSRSAESAVSAVQTSLNAASTRLEQLNATLLQLATVSKQKAEIERDKGTSCPNSKPGDGPRRRMRDDDAARFAFASDFVAGRVAAVKADMGALDGDLAKIATGDPSIIDPKSGTRNEFMKALSRKLDMTVSSFNALRTDPQLSQMRADLTERAGRSTFGDPKSGGFVCPDAQLSQALMGAARAIAELPVLEKPTIAAVEGSEATIEAFRRLTATFYGILSFKLPPSADELRELQKKAVQQVEAGKPPVIETEQSGLSKRDYVPLAVAIFVDICLLLVSIGRPMNRLHGLVPKMREAERGPIIEILSRFNDIHRDAGVRESFELFRHVVFDVHGAYYVAVPLDAPPRLAPEERENLRIEAQLLANLFTSFEKDRIFKRTWMPFGPTVRRRLGKQGSKFAGSEAFRVYRFRDGAWSEIILGAVMGAARRAEAEADRRRIEAEYLSTPAEPTPRDPRLTPAVDRPETFDRAFYRTRESMTAAPSEQPTTRGRAPFDAAAGPLTTRTEPNFTAATDAQPSADLIAKFGVHAARAERELAMSKAAAEALAAANNNTAPHVQLAAARQMPIAPPQAPAANQVDVVLKRETATLTLPLTDQASDDALINRLSEALTGLEASDAKYIFAPEPKPASHLQALTVVANSEPAPTEEYKAIEDLEAEIESDASTADAARMAGRLRPVIAGE